MFNNLRLDNIISGLILLLCLFFVNSVTAQNQNPKEIRQKMAKIRQSTNWDDPVASKKANDEIKKLAKQLMLGGQNNTSLKDDQTKEQQDEGVEYKMKLWGQIWESVRPGESGDILLGKPIREEIIEEYKEDEKIKFGSLVSDELEILVIDMSNNGVQILIDNMDLFKSIKTLLITGGENCVPADLNLILKKAKQYPLTALYIVNFKNHVNSLPSEISHFQNLDTLGIFGNKLSSLPSSVEMLKKIKVLYLDNNPIKTLFPGIIQLKDLEKLGLINTSIPESELLKIKNLLPNCKVLKQ